MDPPRGQQGPPLPPFLPRLTEGSESCCSEDNSRPEDPTHHHDDEANRPLSWHHPVRPLPYAVLHHTTKQDDVNGRTESFRSISHDSAVPQPRRLMGLPSIKEEALHDWMKSAVKIGRNPLWTLRHPDLQPFPSETSHPSPSLPPSPGGPPFVPQACLSSPPLTRALSYFQTLAYSVGHVVNDLGGACWFTYGVYFLETIAITGENSQIKTGQVMLAGQIADAIATVVFGILADKSTMACCERSRGRFGPKKLWHLVGSVMVILGFAALFGFNPFGSSSTAGFIYLCIASSLFNVGWAAVQVSHLALIPELTALENERCRLVSLRYTFTVLCNLFVFILYLTTGEDSKHKYLLITIIVIAVGTGSNIMFWGGVNEQPRKHVSLLTLYESEEERSPLVDERRASKRLMAEQVGDEDEDEETMRARLRAPILGVHKKPARGGPLRWFTVKDFYIVGLVYMLARVAVNLTSLYMTLYIENSLYQGRPPSDSKQDRALVPLTLYFSSFLVTFKLEDINRRLGRKATFVLGAVLVTVAGLFFYFIRPESAGLVYLGAIILGFGNTIIMVTSVSMEGDLVGHDTSSSAFVYGTLSFTDKLTNGLLILWIAGMEQSSCPKESTGGQADGGCAALFRDVMFLSSAAPALLGGIVALFVSPPKQAG